MTYFANKYIPRKRIARWIEKISTTPTTSWAAEFDASQLAKLQLWQEVVAASFPGSEFNPLWMIEVIHKFNKSIIIDETLFAQLALFEARENAHPTIMNWGDDDAINYGTLDIGIKKWHGEFSRQCRVDFVALEKDIYTELEKAGLIEEGQRLYTDLSTHYSHNIFHAATEIDESKFPRMNGLHKKLNSDKRNTRVKSGTNGYEEFMLQVNQQVFLLAREKNSPWFRHVVSICESAVEFYEKAEKKITPPHAKELRKSMEQFFSAFVPRALLTASDIKEWPNILRTAEPQVPSPVFYIDGEPNTLSEVSLKLYNACQKDYANLGIYEGR